MLRKCIRRFLTQGNPTRSPVGFFSGSFGKVRGPEVQLIERKVTVGARILQAAYFLLEKLGSSTDEKELRFFWADRRG
jgi:hypothetical protein